MTFCEPISSGSSIETPPSIFDPLNQEFAFVRDVCASTHNHKCDAYWSVKDDALSQQWTGMLWMNPPYGRGIGDWVQKAYDSACDGYATVVCLLPVRSDNEWWKLVIQAEVRFIRGRIRFVGTKGSCMFPVCVAIFHAYLDPGSIMKVWRP